MADEKEIDAVQDLGTLLPSTKFVINYKDEKQLTKDLHYVANHLFPLCSDAASIYTADSDTSQSDYTLRVVQGGITNLLFLMTPKSNDNTALKSRKHILIRVYGENTEVLIDRPRDERIFYDLGKVGFGPQLYGLFGNGRIEEWYSGAHAVKLHEQKHCQQIAAVLADMHAIHPSFLSQERSTASLWTVIDEWYDIASKVEFVDQVKQKKYKDLDWPNIVRQIKFMKCILPSEKNQYKLDEIFAFIVEQFNDDPDRKQKVEKKLFDEVNKMAFRFMCEVVFSHNDLLGGNVLYLQEKQQIKFIDFEYGSYNFRAFDFANHFCEYAGFDGNWKNFPNKAHIREFARDYVARFCSEQNDKHEQIDNNVLCLIQRKNGYTSQDIERFLDGCYDAIMLFTAIDNYFWGLWAVVQAKHSPIDFDFLEYANERLVIGYQYAIKSLSEFVRFPC
eukprot:CAMPEP_0202694752 /NCGR_PEP_ID=MMETSP1385-20130828/8531_1 /ASSEMBLY_ACC=CAM_ASM_000861 /TAXON_ID=933848 /ORGANISM="Elphidium margaritaceum" /LENGTH=446 /DNA_ID=CAMNT_0049350651 /DNA_START=28 /DNA_END=1368 /DNA_ORIENTATION=+